MSKCPVTVKMAREKRDKHWARVTAERLHLENAILESRRRKDMLFCEIDGMDSSKTILPHSLKKNKATKKDLLLKMHLTCVKYNGLQPDDVYLFSEAFPHDSSNVITTMWLTVLKDLERRGPDNPLKKIWFQLDNTGRENKNRYVICFAEWLVHMGIAEEIHLSFLPVG